MDATEIRGMVDSEILETIEELKETLFKLRFQKEIGQLEDHSQLGVVRRNIARCKTILRERQLAAELVRDEDA